MLSMLLIISGKGTVTGKELAEHFEVSLRMKNLHGLFGRNEAFNDIMLKKISRGEDGSRTLQLYYDRNVYKVKFIYIDPFTQEEKLINEETYRFGVQFMIPSKSVWGLGVTGIGWKALDGAPEIDEYAMNLVPAQNVTYELILPDEGSGEGGEGGEGENPGFPGFPGFPGSQFPGLTGFIKF